MASRVSARLLLKWTAVSATGMWLQEDATATWLSVTLGKLYIGHYAPDMVQVQERFPPLRVRAKEWGVEGLLHELALQKPAWWFGHQRRNEVLLHELFTRELDENTFRSIMQMRGVDHGKALELALEAGRGPRYRPALVELLRSLARDPMNTFGPGKGGPEIYTFLWNLKRAKDVDLTPEVIEEARSGNLDFAEIMYLTERIQSPSDAHEFLQLLAQKLDGDSNHDFSLKDARRRICERMALLDCGTFPTPPPRH